MNKQTDTSEVAYSNVVPSKTRNSNIELFRIISMLLIVAHHYVVNSGLSGSGGVIFSNPTAWQSVFLVLLGAWGKTGINCFVLITGYFMCKSNITLKKYAKLLLEIYLYRIIGYIIFLFAGYEQLSVIRIIKLLLPVTSISNGFTGCYIVFFLFIPFLNVLVHNMTEKQHILLLILTGTVYVIIGSVPGFTGTFNYVTWFCVLYIISSYIRLYPKKIFENTRFWGLASLASVLIAAASVVVCFVFPPMIGKTSLPYIFVADSNKVLAVAVGVSGFMFFKNLKIKPNRFINSVAATTFGVLLIHANSEAMRQWLWRDTLDNVGMYSSPYLILHAVGSVICIFAICSAIDYLRIRIIEKPFFDNCWDKIEFTIKNLAKKLQKQFEHIAPKKL